MTSIATTQYIELLRKSKLVDISELDRILVKLGSTADDVEKLGSALMGQELISPWHHEKLKSGKWKGFFLGKYKIIDKLGGGGMGRVYLGRDRTPGTALPGHCRAPIEEVSCTS